MEKERFMQKNEQYLRENVYPGRGIVLGATPSGAALVQVYWIMGRSENSRNRVFVETADGVKTEAFDPSKMIDPSLVIYYVTRTVGDKHIVTNGDQTDTVADFLKKGGTFEAALLTRCYEPDAPNCTPRISGMTDAATGAYSLSILKTVGNDENCEEKAFFTYKTPINGTGHCIHTYDGDGSPLPSFSGEPYEVSLCETARENAEKFWDMLDRSNRVSLLVKHIDCASGKVETVIVNRNGGEEK